MLDQLEGIVAGTELIDGEKAGVPEAFVPRKLDAVVRDYVLRTLDHFSNQRELAARELGISLEELDRIAGS